MLPSLNASFGKEARRESSSPLQRVGFAGILERKPGDEIPIRKEE